MLVLSRLLLPRLVIQEPSLTKRGMGVSTPSPPMEPLPEKMTGVDLVRQEEHELNLERALLKGIDRVDRRDKRGEILSSVPSRAYMAGYGNIDWSKRA